MAFYDKFPYTNFQELNLDKIMHKIGDIDRAEEASAASAAAAKASEINAGNSEQAAAASAESASQSADASATSATESAQYLDEIGTHTAGVVADWLAEHLTPTTPPVDASLTIAGAAADAKVTGDAVTGLKSAILDKRYNIYDGKLKQTGVYWNENGELTESETWGITEYMPLKYGKMYYKGLISMGTNTKAIFADANYNFISSFRPQPYIDGREVALASIVEIPGNAEYISFSLAISQHTGFKFMVDPSVLVDASLTIAGAAADAKATGDAVTGLKSAVTGLKSAILDKRYNIYDGKLKQTGVYWNENGGLTESETWGITEYMPLKYGKMYYKGLISMGTNTKAIFADANYNFISSFRPQPYLDGREVALDSIVEIPGNAEYISFTLAVKEHSEFQFLLNPNEYLTNDIDNLSIRVTQVENRVTQIEFNNVLVGNDNMMWSWWLYPQAVSLQRVRNKLYYGYVTSDGYKGVAEYDFDSKTVIKNNIIKAGVDDHNALAVYVFPSGRIVCAYSTGHNEDNKVRVRRSVCYESVTDFGKEIELESTGLTSYAQMCYSNGKLYLFYRVDTKNWAYRTSTNEGATWTDETILITSNIQYYCMFRPTTVTNVLRVLMYSNPALGEDTDTNIRQAFLHTDNNTLYNSDNAAALGTSNINKDNISILIPNETGTLDRQRLFDCAVTAVERPLVLYAPFHMNHDSIYKLYDTGVVTQISGGGTDIAYTYQMGACFNGPNEIIVARGSGVNGGTDFIEQYAYNDGVLGTPSVIYSEVRGNVPIRNFRPIADVNGKAVLWVRGYYDSTAYNNYDTDAKLKVMI